MVRLKYYLFSLLIIASMVGAAFVGGTVRADQFDQQIAALEAKNAKNQDRSDSLANTAATYQQAINTLSARISGLQDNIVQTQAQIDALQKQIDKAEADLKHEKQVLGENIRTMYLEGDISTLEILASSKNLSDFVNKQQYRNSVANKVKDSVDKIDALKAQLTKKQEDQKSLLADLQKQQNELQSQENQKAQLLHFTEAQKAAYDRKISANNSQIASLRAQQAALNQQLGGVPTAGDPGHGGYPSAWSNAPMDSLIDSFGMYNRECVSYTAWKVYQTFGHMPYWGGVGNANQWPGDAQAAGIPIGTTPRVHSVAIWNVGAFGHAMWVEAVNGNTIWVSQFNYDFTGHYSEMSINAGGLTYIYFH